MASQPNNGQQNRPARNSDSKNQSNDGKRNRRRGNGKRSSNNSNNTIQTSTFRGKYTEMNGQVFQCHDETNKRNQFEKTIEELGRYAATYMPNAKDIKLMLETLKETIFMEPSDPSFSASRTTIRIWEKEVDIFVERKANYDENKCTIFAIILGQCSDTMKAKLKGHAAFKAWESTHDVIGILTEITAISNRFDNRTCFLEAYLKVKTSFFSFKQDDRESNTDYLSHFGKLVEIGNHYGVSLTSDDILWKHELLLNEEIETLNEDISGLIYNEAALRKAGGERLKAYIFIQGADNKRFKDLHRELKKSLALDDNKYPATQPEALTLLNRFSSDLKQSNQTNNKDKPGSGRDKNKENKHPNPKLKLEEEEDEGEDGVTLEQDSETKNKAEGISKGEIQLLQKVAEDEDDDDEEPIHFLLTQLKTAIPSKNRISPTWILLDNQSTYHIFNNRKQLRNVRKCKPGDKIKIHSNGNGYLIADLIGDLPGVGEVHYHPDSIANVLSLSKIAEKYPVCFNGRKDNAFIVYGNNNVVRFAHSKHGLYYYDTAANKENVQLVQTVKSNEAQFTKRQVDQAKLARQLYSLLGRPSHEAFVQFIRSNSLKNCPVDVNDANRSIQIYGQDIPALRGKSVRQQPGHVTVPDISPVPPDILLNHSKIHLCVDVCFVNNIAFLVTISRHIKLRTVDHLPDTQQSTVLKSLQQVSRIYTSRGFSIDYIHADSGYRGLEHDLLPARLNLAAAGEHVPEIERNIRTLKERTRACIHGLPYKRHPTQMIIANMRFHNTWLNRFPAKDGVSSTLSPRSIVWGDTPDFNFDYRLDFGSYCEVYEPRQTTNSTAAHTVGAIALCPSGNNQGGYRFLVLSSCRVVTHNQWTCLPIPTAAIDIIEALALKESQPDISKHGYIFSWKKIRNIPNADLSSDNVITDEGANADAQIPDNPEDDDDSYAPSTDSENDESLDADTDNE